MTGNQTMLDEVLNECEVVLRHHDMYYSGELCAELQRAFEKISRSTTRRSVRVDGRVSFPPAGIAGFSRVIVLDARRAVSPAGIFHFEVFIEIIARSIAEVLGLDLDTRNLHREQLSQLLKDERGILFGFFSVDYLTERHHRQLRGLGFTQTDHRILFCGRNEFLRRQWTSSSESPSSKPVPLRARIVHSDSSRTDTEQDSPEVTVSPELRPTAHLRVLAGGSVQPVYAVEIQGVSIGRAECDVVITGDPRISRKHARIERSFDGWQFRDLGSRNGSYVNGRESDRGLHTPLPDGSVIRLGGSVMVFRTTRPPANPRIDSPVFPGVSPEAADVRQWIDELAGSVGHVLILGQTATDKESVAQAIGAQRDLRPFVTLHCAQLDRETIHSELFGHDRGVFTTAPSPRPGAVDLAGDGTLFLDEIGDLPLDDQAELLRLLEDGAYRAPGSPDLRKSFARVVLATSIDLDEAHRQGRFRGDLLAWLRATSTSITLPPLRSRREDVLAWTQLFFRQHGREPGDRPWTAAALECLLLYPWQENLRELLAAVDFAVGQTLKFPCTRAHLPPQVRAHRDGLRMPVEIRLHDPIPTPPTGPVPGDDLPPDPTRG